MHVHRRGTRLLLLVAVALLLPLLRPAGSAASQPPPDHVLRVHQKIYPDVVDPQQSSFSTEISILVQNYEGLTRLGQDSRVEPAAAERWDLNGDATVATFHLRDGLTYSDGSPLTADRFVEAAQRTCDPNVAGDYQYILFDVVGCAEFAGLYGSGEAGATPVATPDASAYDAARRGVGVRALDERTVEVRLTHSAPYFPAIAGLWVFFPAKQELVERGGAGWWQDPALQVGNGPFQLTRMEADQLVAFAPNERYWGGRPQLDRLEYVYVGDTAVALEAYAAGDLDIMQPDASQLSVIRDDQELSADLLTFPAAATAMLAFNLEEAPFDNKRVREAFAYAFDRETYCRELYSGDCLSTHSWVPPGIPGAVESDAYAFDPERARRALAESSYGGPAALPEITYAYFSDNPIEGERAEWVAEQYREVLGVGLRLQPLDGGTYIGVLSDPEVIFPQITPAGWFSDYPDPQNWLSVVWSCGGAYAAVAGYCNPAFDELTDQGDAGIELADRLPFYERAERQLLADVPAVFVFNEVNTFLVKPQVTGYVTTAADVEWPGVWASPTTIDVVLEGAATPAA